VLVKKFIFSDDIELVCLSSPEQSEEILSEMTIIDNFQCTENFLDYFESSYVLNLLEDNNKVFLFKLEIQEAYSNLNSTELSKLTDKCRNNSVVILLSTEKGKRFFLYWKSSKIQHFLIFKPYNRLDIMHNILIFEFLATFFTNSLRRDHLGKIFNLSNFKYQGLVSSRGTQPSLPRVGIPYPRVYSTYPE